MTSCTLFSDRTTRAERSIDSAVLAFQNQRQRYPRDLAELQEFAAGRMSLDTSPFSQVHFVHPTPTTLRVDLIPGSEEDVAVSISYAATTY